MGGSIIVPAFAVGRTQQLMMQLNEIAEKGEIPHLPVYIDSPLAVDVTSIFRSHPECYDYELSPFIMKNTDDEDSLSFEPTL